MERTASDTEELTAIEKAAKRLGWTVEKVEELIADINKRMEADREYDTLPEEERSTKKRFELYAKYGSSWGQVYQSLTGVEECGLK